jgi:hypothetical protein
MPAQTPIRFHWSRRRDGNSDGVDEFVRFCHDAEAVGVESVHVPIESSLSDALALARAAGKHASSVRFRIGWDFGGVLASLSGRELLTTWDALQGRLIVHMSFAKAEPAINGDTPAASEFIANCRALFGKSQVPQFDVQGETAEAAFLAIKHGDCLWRSPDRPRQVFADALPVLHFGKEVGMFASIIARNSREEALDAAATLLQEHTMHGSYVWIGRTAGSPNTTPALVGSFEWVARAIHEFKASGISQFLIREWPGRREMTCFGSRILPLVRALESGQQIR